jgi:hypothetical protein
MKKGTAFFAFMIIAGWVSGQNVGINNGNPDYPLTITAPGAGNELLSFRSLNNQPNWNIKLGNEGDLNIAESLVADNRLFLKKGGRIGINTGNPSATLTINGSGNQNIDLLVNGRIRIGDANNNGGIWLSEGNNLFVGMSAVATAGGFWTAGRGWNTFNIQTLTGNIGIGGPPDDVAKFSLFGNSKLTGDVNIGSTDQNANLLVNGNIGLSGTINLGPSIITTFTDHTLESGISRITQSCPSGYTVISGGGGHRDFNQAADDVQLNYSGVDFANPRIRWVLIMTNTNSSTRTVRVCITCAKN